MPTLVSGQDRTKGLGLTQPLGNQKGKNGWNLKKQVFKHCTLSITGQRSLREEKQSRWTQWQPQFTLWKEIPNHHTEKGSPNRAQRSARAEGQGILIHGGQSGQSSWSKMSRRRELPKQRTREIRRPTYTLPVFSCVLINECMY